MQNYIDEALRRFLFTLDLVPEDAGRILEIGSNPYFMSRLVQRFRPGPLYCSNFFDRLQPDHGVQVCVSRPTPSNRLVFEFCHFNVEDEPAPFPDGFFRGVLFCEVLEHLTSDPLRSLLHLRRVLAPDGWMVLTTPNASRMENVVRLLHGQNIYDQYSGYGPYGRHNREYTREELIRLLSHAGFEVELSFTADVRDVDWHTPLQMLAPYVRDHAHDLGAYIFVRARNSSRPAGRKPGWLYRSYPPDEMADGDSDSG